MTEKVPSPPTTLNSVITITLPENSASMWTTQPIPKFMAVGKFLILLPLHLGPGLEIVLLGCPKNRNGPNRFKPVKP